MTIPLPVGQGRLARSFLPPTAVLELTYRCNHRCVFCSCPWYAEGGGYCVAEERPIAWWKSALEVLAGMGVHQVAFTGGEPLCKDGVHELLDHAARLTAPRFVNHDGQLVEEWGPLSLTLLTNGTLLDERTLDRCARHGVHVGISLPGLSTFAYHTEGGDRHTVLRAFQATKARKIPTHVGITVTRRNLHELHETMAEALLAGADSVLLNRFMPGGRGLSHVDDLRLTPDEILRMIEIADAVLAQANRPGHLGTEIPKCLVAGRSVSHLALGHRCAAATDFFAVDPSGFVRACNHSPLRLGHLDAVSRVVQHPEWMRFVRKDFHPEDCAGCASMGSCDAGCREAARIVHGAPDAVDPMVPVLVPLRAPHGDGLQPRSASR